MKRYAVRRIDPQSDGLLMDGNIFETDSLDAAVTRRAGNLNLVIIDRRLADQENKEGL